MKSSNRFLNGKMKRTSYQNYCMWFSPTHAESLRRYFTDTRHITEEIFHRHTPYHWGDISPTHAISLRRYFTETRHITEEIFHRYTPYHWGDISPTHAISTKEIFHRHTPNHWGDISPTHPKSMRRYFTDTRHITEEIFQMSGSFCS